MSEKVDVLAVMADAMRYETKAGAASEWIAELSEARAAVADLIEALRMSDEWIREAVNHGGCKLKSEQTLYQNRQALARAGALA